jgi:hypothetical protein
MADAKEELRIPRDPVDNEVLNKPTIAFRIERNKNQNVVVYEGVLLEDGTINPQKPIDVYWQKIDPEYIKKTRASGKNDDRQELMYVESMFAYGISTRPADTAGEHILTLVALPKRELTLRIDPDSNNMPRAFAQSGEHYCRITRIWVQSIERTFALPKVEYVLVEGVDVKTGEVVVEKIIP